MEALGSAVRGRVAALAVGGMIAVAAGLAAVLDGGPWGPATAQAVGAAPRTWVSGVGDDVNPCSRTAPCKTFAGAISKTAQNGEIVVMDPGAYGAVTITWGVTIEADGDFAGLLNSLTNGIIVNAGPNDNVVIRGLTIDGHGDGLNGIRFLAGKSLTVQDVTIANESQNGIDFEPSGDSKLFVSNTHIRNSRGANSAGILVKPQAAGTARVALDNVRLTNNTTGMFLQNGARATVDDTLAAGNNTGFNTESAALLTKLALANSVVSDNSNAGIIANGAAATVTLASTSIANNAVGLSPKNGGQIQSFGTSPDSDSGNPTATLPLK